MSIISSIPQPDLLTDLPDNIEWVEVVGALNETINLLVSESKLDWVLQLLPGDMLFPHSLWSFAESINQNDQACLYIAMKIRAVYCLKPDFNLELLTLVFIYWSCRNS
ncbi:MAG: hypothetical protein Q9N32_01640 [Gammaproteobacteria bacterium]|nr:hypothetical protein [Gammaproteobacteria bacterium]